MEHRKTVVFLAARVVMILVCCTLALTLTACRSIGPGAVKRDRLHYSSAVADSWKPDEAFVAVPYEGLWFWIERNDLGSKTTLGTVTMLFNFLEGGSKMSPVLTIPTN